MRKAYFTIFAMMALSLSLAFPAPAKACVSRILAPPSFMVPYLEGKPVHPSDELIRLTQSYQRDKAYYDALVSEFCMVTPQTDLVAADFRRQIDGELIALIAKKWMDVPKPPAP